MPTPLSPVILQIPISTLEPTNPLASVAVGIGASDGGVVKVNNTVPNPVVSIGLLLDAAHPGGLGNVQIAGLATIPTDACNGAIAEGNYVGDSDGTGRMSDLGASLPTVGPQAKSITGVCLSQDSKVTVILVAPIYIPQSNSLLNPTVQTGSAPFAGGTFSTVVYPFAFKGATAPRVVVCPQGGLLPFPAINNISPSGGPGNWTGFTLALAGPCTGGWNYVAVGTPN